ncbi:metallophosphoesterase family protein [Acetivibrio cellulolyticus]|uniref:metallophosphoesterase family protein n=1 Tax=Acetivibrio cellulolyticus TaxID=35830 RepID=UPI0001E2DEDE|nr:metallophosphoesterase family protein [Acetivibrio cellulolyticus]
MDIITIGVVSDTHIPSRGKVIPDIVLKGFKGVDMIIHAGDLLKDYVIYELEEIAPVHAVAGNNDDFFMQDKLGKKRILDAGGVKIGITHGHIGHGGNALKNAINTFKDDDVNCVVFGHSHTPYNEEIDGVLFFNPGSPTDKRWQEYYSYGIIKIQNKKVSAQIKYFER